MLKPNERCYIKCPSFSSNINLQVMGQDLAFCFHFYCFLSKGNFELEPVWQDSILLPNHLS